MRRNASKFLEDDRSIARSSEINSYLIYRLWTSKSIAVPFESKDGRKECKDERNSANDFIRLTDSHRPPFLHSSRNINLDFWHKILQFSRKIISRYHWSKYFTTNFIFIENEMIEGEVARVDLNSEYKWRNLNKQFLYAQRCLIFLLHAKV